MTKISAVIPDAIAIDANPSLSRKTGTFGCPFLVALVVHPWCSKAKNVLQIRMVTSRFDSFV